MDVADDLLVRLLEARDGRFEGRFGRHRAPDGSCRFAALYPDGGCPWCEAEMRREDRAAASVNKR
jgi:hypothetical protein